MDQSMYEDWNLDDTDFMKELNNMFSLKPLLKNIWKWIINIGIYWIPGFGMMFSLLFDYVNKIKVRLFLCWVLYHTIAIVLIASLISLYN